MSTAMPAKLKEFVEEIRSSAQEPQSATTPWHCLTWSADSSTELDELEKKLSALLRESHHRIPSAALRALQAATARLPHRRALVCRDCEDALHALESDRERILSASESRSQRKVAFLLPGQGAQYVNMGKELYDNVPDFRADIDHCCDFSKSYLKLDLRDLLYPATDKVDEIAERLAQTRYTQTAIFSMEYALARQWIRWGVEPMGMIGHSLGEFAAACIAGVFTVEEGLRLVAIRGKLMQQVGGGAMLSAMLSEAELKPLLDHIGGLEIAVMNTPSSCVVSGSKHKIEMLETELTKKEVMSRRLRVTGAGHSSAVEPVLDEFRRIVNEIPLQLPRMPYLSNLAGKWISGAEITNPDYWVNHLRNTVRFSDGAAELLKDPDLILLEVGPGTTLSKLIAQHSARPPQISVISSLPSANEPQPDMQYMLSSLARLWLEGASLDPDRSPALT